MDKFDLWQYTTTDMARVKAKAGALLPLQVIGGYLSPELWGSSVLTRRSRELTPLFIQRKIGSHVGYVVHYHDCWEFTYVFSGQGILQADAPYPLKPGLVYLLPPGTVHVEQSHETMDTFWFGLRGSRLRGQKEKGMQFGRCPQVAPILELLWLSAVRPFPPLKGPELDGLAQAALARFFSFSDTKHTPEELPLDQVLEWLQRDFQTPIHVAELAAKLGFSLAYFCRAFRRRTGATPMQYITRLRIEHARKLLLHSSLSVSRVARLVGYSDPLYFSRVFKKLTGIHPSASKPSMAQFTTGCNVSEITSPLEIAPAGANRT